MSIGYVEQEIEQRWVGEVRNQLLSLNMLGNNLVGPRECAPNVRQFKAFVRKDFLKFIDLGGHNILKSKRQLSMDWNCYALCCRGDGKNDKINYLLIRRVIW